MSEENVELVRGVPGDMGRLIDLLDEEVVIDNRRYTPLDIAGVYHGKEAATELIRKWVGSWRDFEFQIEETTDAGAAVVLVIRERGRGIGSGAPMENHYVFVWHFLSNRIVRATTFETKAKAMEALGLSE